MAVDVLGRVVEAASGKRLSVFLDERLFQPLKMVDTSFWLPAAKLPRLAQPTAVDPASGQKISVIDVSAEPGNDSGGAGALSTAMDYLRFGQMLLNGGELDGKRYLTPASFKAMTTDHIGPGSGVGRDYFYFPGDGFGYGFGIAVRTDPGNAKPPPPGSIGELKWDSGSGTYFGVDPKFNMVYIMMEQTQNERTRITPIFRKVVYSAFMNN